MLANSQLYARLEANTKKADETIALLEKHLERLEKQAVGGNLQASYEQQKEILRKENKELQEKVGYLKKELENVEVQNGLKLVHVPKKAKCPIVVNPMTEAPKEQQVSSKDQKPPSEKEKKKSTAKKEKAKEAKPKGPAAAEVVDISRLDLRIGHIIDVKRHPDADTLYVEQMDLGEGKPRTIVTGVVEHVPVEKMQDRMVMVLCNLKPVKMRGIFSQGMVMCASSPELVEVLDPPPGCVPGDLIECEGYPRTPDDQLNPKKKIFEKIQPDLHIDDQCIAKYKGSAFVVAGKPGYFKSQTMKNSNIK